MTGKVSRGIGRRILAILLALSLLPLGAAVRTSAAPAGGPASLNLTVNRTEAVCGDLEKVSVLLDGSLSELGCFEVHVYYDPEVMEPDEEMGKIGDAWSRMRISARPMTDETGAAYINVDFLALIGEPFDMAPGQSTPCSSA